MAHAHPDIEPSKLPSALSSPDCDPVLVTKSLGFWRTRFATLTIGSVGVVYGDIGTSPLYAFREALHAAADNGVASREVVIGVLSLILWALIIVVTVKYVLILMRADNNGEGGTLALMAVVQRLVSPERAYIPLALGLIGTALFYGDAMITPAISVLSAVEGLKLVAPKMSTYVVPITLAILITLFYVQHKGTAGIASWFGPIMVVWFIVIGLAGIYHIAQAPFVLQALWPYYAVKFLLGHGAIGFFTLGAVFLAVTGAEALYADLGHFGRGPIQWAWFALVLPALALNYAGQAALVSVDPAAGAEPFYSMFPQVMLLPMVLLATIATVIASQAVITGAFSLSRQAIQMGFLPRLEVRHTSDTQAGQIYMPHINSAIAVGVMFLVMLFQSSDRLSTAYGIAVTGTMLTSVSMAFIVMLRLWKWSLRTTSLVMAPLILLDVVFLIANGIKIFEGGWITLAIGGGMLLAMTTWRAGSQIILDKTRKSEVPIDDLIRDLESKPRQRVEGTAIYLTSHPEHAPTALLHTLKHFKVLHERVVLLTLRTEDQPRVPADQAVKVQELSPTFIRIIVSSGFMETPNVPNALNKCRKLGWKFNIMSTSFFLSRRTIKVARPSKMPLWRSTLFIELANNAVDATDYFRIPKDRVVEVGTQVGL